jgi:hypothetical protein
VADDYLSESEGFKSEEEDITNTEEIPHLSEQKKSLKEKLIEKV